MVGDEKVRGQTEKKGHVPNVNACPLLLLLLALTGMKVSSSWTAKTLFSVQRKGRSYRSVAEAWHASLHYQRFGTSKRQVPRTRNNCQKLDMG